jgi:hypothetical protein
MTLVNNRADVPVTFGETARGHRNCVQRANFRGEISRPGRRLDAPEGTRQKASQRRTFA